MAGYKWDLQKKLWVPLTTPIGPGSRLWTQLNSDTTCPTKLHWVNHPFEDFHIELRRPFLSSDSLVERDIFFLSVGNTHTGGQAEMKISQATVTGTVELMWQKLLLFCWAETSQPTVTCDNTARLCGPAWKWSSGRELWCVSFTDVGDRTQITNM